MNISQFTTSLFYFQGYVTLIKEITNYLITAREGFTVKFQTEG